MTSTYRDSLREGDVKLDTIALANGGELTGANLHYRTLGVRRCDDQQQVVNAVLLLHGTTGDGRQFLKPDFAEAMFGPDQPLDTSKWFVVIPDALGHGETSKPSDGLYDEFPQYGYRDIVSAHRLLLERLGLRHLRLVMGTSMGGMNAWLWGAMYPDAMDALVAVACGCAPITGRNLLWRRIIATAIRTDPAFIARQFDRPFQGLHATWPVFALMTNSPLSLDDLQTPADADDFLEKNDDAAPNPIDLLFALEASGDYDLNGELGRIQAPLLAINFADDEVNPAELNPLDSALSQVPSMQAVTHPGGDGSYGHQNLSHASTYAADLADFLDRLANPTPLVKPRICSSEGATDERL